MGIEIHQLHPLFVGEIRGMDLGRPLEAAGARARWEAIDRYAVLVFHDQRLSDEQQAPLRQRPADDVRGVRRQV